MFHAQLILDLDHVIEIPSLKRQLFGPDAKKNTCNIGTGKSMEVDNKDEKMKLKSCPFVPCVYMVNKCKMSFSERTHYKNQTNNLFYIKTFQLKATCS